MGDSQPTYLGGTSVDRMIEREDEVEPETTSLRMWSTKASKRTNSLSAQAWTTKKPKFKKRPLKRTRKA